MNHLPRYVIGIDVETTALEPQHGDIIEIAAIRFDTKTRQEVERFVRFAKPIRPISTEITAITGITDDDVATAPPFTDHVRALLDFVGTETLVAHNAAFDINFLAYHGAKLPGLVWDTFFLASCAWPESASYNLGHLARELTLDVASEHRAAHDVELTWKLFCRSLDALTVSPAQFERVQRVLAQGSLAHYQPLFRVSERATSTVRPASSADMPARRVLAAAAEKPAPTMEQVFGAGGQLARQLTGFQARPNQVRMAKVVAMLINRGGTGLVEAPTGSGKSYAYLVPSLFCARRDRPVLISTHTKHLQDQLVEHDIPVLMRALGLNRRVAVLKGRRNYICGTRLHQYLARKRFTPPDAQLLTKILLWLDKGGNGDLGRLNVSHQQRGVLNYLHADAATCGRQCRPSAGEHCPYQHARLQAETADCIVVNHAWLAAGAHDALALRQPRAIVIDEAHHLVEAARAASKLPMSASDLDELLAPLRTAVTGKTSAPDRERHILESCLSLAANYQRLLEDCAVFAHKHARQDTLRLTTALRRSSQWQKLVAQNATWRGQLHFLTGLLAGFGEQTDAADMPATDQAVRELEQFASHSENFFTGSDERIQWLQLDPTGQGSTQRRRKTAAELFDVAVQAAPVLQPVLASSHAVVLTSATLTTSGSFSFMKDQLGLSNVQTVRLASEFQLQDNMLIYLVQDGVPPGAPEFDSYVSLYIEKLSLLLSGRVLVLCTSRQVVRALYGRLIRPLNKAGIKLYAQNITGGRTNMLRRFTVQETSVLIGTQGFWEGIDIPGASLSCVIIPKLPFPLPYDPLIAGVAEAENINAFRDLAVPTMLLKLQQGIGRLIRTATDRGVVVLLDRRIHDHAYGQDVMNSLPGATIHAGSGAGLIPAVTDWFGTRQIDQWRARHASELTLS